MGLNEVQFRAMVLDEQTKWGPMPGADAYLKGGEIKTLVEAKEKPTPTEPPRPKTLEDVHALLKYGKGPTIPDGTHQQLVEGVRSTPLPAGVHQQLREAIQSPQESTALPDGIHQKLARAFRG